MNLIFYIYLICVCIHTCNRMYVETNFGGSGLSFYHVGPDDGFGSSSMAAMLPPAETSCWECTVWWAWTGLCNHLATVKAMHWNTLPVPSGSLHSHFSSCCRQLHYYFLIGRCIFFLELHEIPENVHTFDLIFHLEKCFWVMLVSSYSSFGKVIFHCVGNMAIP